MLSFETLLLFVPTIALLVILPGPDFAIVSKSSLLDGRKQGQMAALGVSLGMCVHTILAMFGISAILARSAVLFSILKYLGACYLFYLGIKALIQSFNKNGASTNQVECINSVHLKKKPVSLWKSFQVGFLTNVLNPKAILYFMVLYPQFLDSNSPVFMQFFEMGLITAVICLGWYISLAWLLGKIRVFFTKDIFQRWLLRITGGIFMAFGLRLAIQK